jgi:crotonobetainyl-CoA:carnitine CoA-transferase CaiB-like acyl-CoA transferase
MAVEVEHPTLGTTTQVGLPFELSATPASIRTAPPLLGEHSEEILAAAGYSAREIAALHGDGVI